MLMETVKDVEAQNAEVEEVGERLADLADFAAKHSKDYAAKHRIRNRIHIRTMQQSHTPYCTLHMPHSIRHMRCRISRSPAACSHRAQTCAQNEDR